ncbi:MAG: hypothetical protein ACRDKX_06150 [Solirubrobacterales bacterium]
MRRRPSPALVIALAALFVSLGGAAYAVNLGKNDVKSPNIARKAVKGSDIAPNAVKRSKIKGGAVNAKKLANNAVDESAIAEDAVTRKKIKAQAVTTPKIADLGVETAKLADGNVTEAKLADGAVTAAKLGANSVRGGAMLASFTVEVDPPDVAPECVTETEAVSGVTEDDHVLVTIAPPGLPPDIVSTGAAGDDVVEVRVCRFETFTVVGPTDFNVLVVG